MSESESDARLRIRIGEASAALLRAEETHPGLAGALVTLVKVVADEAARSPRFAKTLAAALATPAAPTAPPVTAPPVTALAAAAPRAATSKTATPKTATRRSKRAPGPFDPFAVFREGGEPGLRERLTPLTIDELKDIIAEHAMDYDRLAMRWRTPSKLQERIVERVRALTTKGDASR